MLSEPAWLTMVEAERSRITEVDEAGAVSQLKVVNPTNQPLLLLDGEELVGAKQNRVLNTTVLVAAKSELTIPVSCVEQGRWGYRGRHFAPSDASLFASVRQKKAAWVTRSPRRPGAPRRSGRGLGRARVEDRGARYEPHRRDARLLHPYEQELAETRGRSARAGTGGRTRVPLRSLGRHGAPGWRQPLRPSLAAALRRLRRRRDRPEAARRRVADPRHGARDLPPALTEPNERRRDRDRVPPRRRRPPAPPSSPTIGSPTSWPFPGRRRLIAHHRVYYRHRRSHYPESRDCMPRRKQLTQQWQLLQLIDRPAGVAVDDAARGLGCAVRTIWRDLRVLHDAGFPIDDDAATVVDRSGGCRTNFEKRLPAQAHSRRAGRPADEPRAARPGWRRLLGPSVGPPSSGSASVLSKDSLRSSTASRHDRRRRSARSLVPGG